MRVEAARWSMMTGRRMRRHRWTPGSVALALVVAAVVLALALLVLVTALAVALVAGGVYLSYRLARSLLSRPPAPPRLGAPARARVSREARGLLEMARTPDPLDRYLLAVREFGRISADALAVRPEDITRRRTAQRGAELADQALNLHDAVAEIERQLSASMGADGALAGVWELTVAAADLASYCHDLAAPHQPRTLMEIRAFVTRRHALMSRRDGLVARLRDADLHRDPTNQVPVTLL